MLSLLLSILNVGSLFLSLGAGVRAWRRPPLCAARTVLGASRGPHSSVLGRTAPRPVRPPHSPVCSHFRRLSSGGRQRLQPVGTRSARSIQNPAFHSLGQDAGRGTGAALAHGGPSGPPRGAGPLCFMAGRGPPASVLRGLPVASKARPAPAPRRRASDAPSSRPWHGVQGLCPEVPHTCRPVSPGRPRAESVRGRNPGLPRASCQPGLCAHAPMGPPAQLTRSSSGLRLQTTHCGGTCGPLHFPVAHVVTMSVCLPTRPGVPAPYSSP